MTGEQYDAPNQEVVRQTAPEPEPPPAPEPPQTPQEPPSDDPPPAPKGKAA
jgi:hypothetical protein